jgi:uncharacterized protein (TIGR02300 family)
VGAGPRSYHRQLSLSTIEKSALTRPGAATNGAVLKTALEPRELIAVAKAELGTKRQCQNCGAKFFDLNKDPIICPKCGTIFQGAAAARVRPAAKPEEEDTELATPAGVEIVSLDEVEAGEEKAAEPVVDDIDVEEADDDAPDDPFLEEEEEDDDDVSNLIDGDIAPDEET